MNETTQKRQGNFLTRLVRKQIFIPLAALLLLIVFNLIADPSFFPLVCILQYCYTVLWNDTGIKGVRRTEQSGIKGIFQKG